MQVNENERRKADARAPASTQILRYDIMSRYRYLFVRNIVAGLLRTRFVGYSRMHVTEYEPDGVSPRLVQSMPQRRSPREGLPSACVTGKRNVDHDLGVGRHEATIVVVIMQSRVICMKICLRDGRTCVVCAHPRNHIGKCGSSCLYFDLR